MCVKNIKNMQFNSEILKLQIQLKIQEKFEIFLSKLHFPEKET